MTAGFTPSGLLVILYWRAALTTLGLVDFILELVAHVKGFVICGSRGGVQFVARGGGRGRGMLDGIGANVSFASSGDVSSKAADLFTKWQATIIKQQLQAMSASER